MPDMPLKSPAEESSENYGREIISWNFPEFIPHKKTRNWYIVAGLILFGLLIYAIAADNFLFAIIIILAATTWIFQNRQEPSEIKFSVHSNGLLVANKFYRYEDIKNFWIIYRPPEIKSLYFDLKGFLKQNISIDLQSQNPVEIRKILLQYLEEDLEKEDEPFSDHLKKALKL